MFVDFGKTFSKTPQTELDIPKELAEHLSTNLPEGFKYSIDKKTNNLFISLEKNNIDISISGMMLVPTEDQLGILGVNPSFEDIMNYSFNSQEPIPIRFNNDKYVNINGKEISIEQLAFNPFKQHHIVLDSTKIMPPPFPPGFSIMVGNKDKTIELFINRIPNKSLSTMAFESERKKCLSMVYYLDSKKNFLQMTFNVTTKYAKTVDEIIEAIEIHNSFLKGEGYFFGKPLKTNLVSEDYDQNDDALIFWKKVKSLEDKLNVCFNPPFNDLEIETLYDIEEMYNNLINGIPIRHNESITSITSDWNFDKEKDVNASIGQPIYLEFDGQSSYELFGVNIVNPCIISIFNAVFSRMEKDESTNKCTVFLDNESEDKKRYTSILRFVSEKDLLEYKEKKKDRILVFKDAKTRQEYFE